jgi:two-component system, OmpR family, phosphate regulon sensor histidine kinase PhoR
VQPGVWREIWILIAVGIASLLLGAFTNHLFLVVAAAFGLYIAYTLRHLHQLQRWLTGRTRDELPDAGGLWGDVFDEIRRLVKQAKRREDRLAGTLSRMQDATAAMPDAVVILTQRDEIEWVNVAAGRLLGMAYPRDAGVRLGNLVRAPEFAQYLHAADFAEPLEVVSPANGEIFLSIQIIPFGDSQKLVIARDVTRLQRLEQMRRTFVANVSHELRTPLTVLAGYVETLAQMPRFDRNDMQKHLAIMQDQSTRMQRLVDDLLTLSRLETAPPRRHDEVVDVPALLAGLKEQAELLSGDNRHAISLECEPGLNLRGSREELHSAFSNLINNAVRYTRPGGAIRLSWHSDGEGARFAVADTGDGIAPEHIAHLTERFYRVDTARSRASGGTGLGLSIVKHVLLRHNATLAIDSEPGKGSTFSCVFAAERVLRAGTARRSAG